MAARPTSTLEWATESVIEAVEIDGLVVTFGSKLEPTAEWKSSGAKYNENTPRQYINYEFDNAYQWITHLDERYAIGDVHLTVSAENAAAISARLGGTWVQRGSDTVGTASVNVWEKTA